MITGQEKPDSGTIKVGETVQLAYVDQSRDALDPDKTSGRRSPAAPRS
jgi:sulfate-transporting ATPase